MIIEKVELENFKAYKKTWLKFSVGKTKNVTLIYGENGAGKSSVFQAILWCLYGRKLNGKRIIPSEVVIPGKYLKQELSNGESATVRVAITFQHAGERYVLAREQEIRKHGNSLTEDGDETLTLDSTSKSGQSKQYSSDVIQRKIDSILPNTVREYFFFDGEKIDKYTELNNGDEIRTSIKAVLGLDNFEYAKKYLNRAKEYFESQIVAEDNEDYQTYMTWIKELEKKNEDLAESIEALRQEKKKAETDYTKKEKICNDNKEQSELRAQKRSIENDLLRCENNIKQLRDDYLTLLSKPSLALSSDILKEMQALLKKWRDEDIFPAENYNKDLIDKTLSKCTCLICGTKFKKGDKTFKHVERLEKGILFSREVEKHLHDLNRDTALYVDRGIALGKQIQDRFKGFMDEQSRRDKLQDSLDDLRAKIDESVTEDDLRQMEQERDELKFQTIPEFNRQITGLNDEIKKNENEKKKYENALSKISLQGDKDKAYRTKADLCKEARDAVDKLLIIYAEKKRQEINKLCGELFKIIVWKESHFNRVELTPEYELNIYDKFGEPARPDLSAGERQVLSLAFITAMAKASGSDSPFIIDTPFGRISKRPRNAIAENIPENVSQLILFVTDTELTEASEKLFTQRSEKVWTIVFDEETSIASFEEGKHVEQDS